MQIDWWTLALQTINFLVLVWLLTHFLYHPVKNVLERRKQLAEDAFSKAAERESEADAARQRLEKERADLSQQRQEVLRQTHESLEAERKSVLQQARTEADQLLADARATIDRERQDALASLRDETTDLAVDLTARLLHNGAFQDQEATLQAMQRQLHQMPADQAQRLRQDLEANGCRIVVVTARKLDEAEEKRWRDGLRLCLEAEPQMEFRVEPILFGGAELRLPHATLDLSWRGQLSRARDWMAERNES